MYVFPLPSWRGLIGLHHGTSKGAADLFAPAGTLIRSITDGTVTAAGPMGAGGNAVLIHGSDGRDYYYAHMLNAPSVATGQKVTAGQTLGAVGESGNAAGTGPHLHIGIGYGINEGVDAEGGAGLGFDAVSFLQSLAAGLVAGVITPIAGGDGGGGLGGLLDQLGALAAQLSDPAWWARVAVVALGAIFVVMGILIAIGKV